MLLFLELVTMLPVLFSFRGLSPLDNSPDVNLGDCLDTFKLPCRVRGEVIFPDLDLGGAFGDAPSVVFDVATLSL